MNDASKPGWPWKWVEAGPEPTTREQLIKMTVERAVSEFHSARKWAEVARRLDDDGPGSIGNAWAVLLTDHAIDAESRLISTIFCLDPAIHEQDSRRCRYRRWGPRGVRVGGSDYLCLPNPDDEGDPDEDTGVWRMRLAIVDLARVVDLDQCRCEPEARPRIAPED